jgi:hypothetical protein
VIFLKACTSLHHIGADGQRNRKEIRNPHHNGEFFDNRSGVCSITVVGISLSPTDPAPLLNLPEVTNGVVWPRY